MGIIRRAEEKDADGIFELLLQVDMVHHMGRPDIFKGPAAKYTKEELLRIFGDDSTPVLVYETEEGLIAGHAFCVLKQFTNDNIMTDIKTLYVDDICVLDTCRGKGIGRALFEAVKSLARELGCYNITLNVWALNPGAYAFYEKMGLVPRKTELEMILEGGEIK